MILTILNKIFLVLFSLITLIFVETTKNIDLNELNIILGLALILGLLFRIFIDFTKKYIYSPFIKSLKHKQCFRIDLKFKIRKKYEICK